MIVVRIRRHGSASVPAGPCSSRFHLPCSPQRKPTEPFGRQPLPDFVNRNGLPVRVVLLHRACAEIAGPQKRPGTSRPSFFDQLHQHRHVGVLAAVVLEILGLPVEVELAQDDVANRHGKRRVGALLRVQPDVAELGGLANSRGRSPPTWCPCSAPRYRNGVGRPGLRDVRTPQHQEAAIVPVGDSGTSVCSPQVIGRGRRQVAVPVVERHADAAEQRQIARAGGIARPSTWPGSARSRTRGRAVVLAV